MEKNIVIVDDQIGKYLKERRQELGKTQKEMGKILELSNTYISDIEVGRTIPSISTLCGLLEALDGEVVIRFNSDK